MILQKGRVVRNAPLFVCQLRAEHPVPERPGAPTPFEHALCGACEEVLTIQSQVRNHVTAAAVCAEVSRPDPGTNATYLSSSVRWPKAGDDRVTAMPARISSTLRMRVPARSDMTTDWRQDGKVPARREKGIIKAFRALWLFLEVEKSCRVPRVVRAQDGC